MMRRPKANIYVKMIVGFVFLLLFGACKKSTSQQGNSQASQAVSGAIENGIHIPTGLKDGEGLMTVVNNCTICHSAKLITQNSMDAHSWNTTIQWMQETQNLWDLGEKQKIIVDYLVTNYPVEKKSRRANLVITDWVEIE